MAKRPVHPNQRLSPGRPRANHPPDAYCTECTRLAKFGPHCRYHHLEHQGLCPRCGVRPPSPTSVDCTSCRAIRLARQRGPIAREKARLRRKANYRKDKNYIN